ncbi:hypothetical protein AcetOrient_orf02450 [Acetobacter orientalis]|uniref:Uncharacterized protein n=1 Tax=Acetobacter orientalis TaxID=146474 RepID=A0A2Z5ZHV5_9PROT|nr:hypothetical protein AcetOrient_orf02450 [Acetobacter orientalis]
MVVQYFPGWGDIFCSVHGKQKAQKRESQGSGAENTAD